MFVGIACVAPILLMQQRTNINSPPHPCVVHNHYSNKKSSLLSPLPSYISDAANIKLILEWIGDLMMVR